MAKVITDSDNYVAIADAIRDQNGEQTTYKPGEMASAILGIEGGADEETLTALTELETTVHDMAAPVYEGDILVSKPYLKAYGYLQCVAECTDDHTQPVDLYEYLYQRLYIGDRVSTVTINGEEHDTVVQYNDVDYLNIPVAQFEGITKDNYYDSSRYGNDTLIRYYLRVIDDNPELLGLPSFYATYYSTTGKVTSIGVPLITYGEREEMLTACKESAEKIDAKVYEIYQLKPGDELTVEQKKKVSKVIHDWIVLNAQYDSANDDEILDQTMYPALSGGVNDPVCASYALAYQWVALRYGIESILVKGKVHNGISAESGGKVTYYGGWHAWNMVNFHEEPGIFGGRSSKWTSLDVTWDDPDDLDIQWTYFLFPWSILPAEKGRYGYRELTHQSYSEYPTDTPMEDDRYTGAEPYVWEDSV